MKYWTWTRELVRNRTGVVVAVIIGFAVGAGGFAAAQRADDTPSTTESTVATESSTTVSTPGPSSIAPDSTTATSTPASSTSDPSPDTTIDDDATSTTIDDSTGTTIDDDATSTTIDDNVDDATSTTIDDATSTTTADDSNNDDATSTTIDDDHGTTNTSTDEDTVELAPFTRVYESSGGSVTVSWTGSQLTIDAINPKPGFSAEVEEQSHDRVRVDFEHDDSDDARIEVRVDDGHVRVDID